MTQILSRSTFSYQALKKRRGEFINFSYWEHPFPGFHYGLVSSNVMRNSLRVASAFIFVRLHTVDPL